MSMQFHAHISCLLIGLALVGCGDSSPQDEVPVARLPKTTTTIQPLVDGPRPQSVAGATVIDMHELHTHGGVDDELVCIEGAVIRSGEVMGPSYVNLACPTCGVVIHCEGYALADFKFDTDTRVAIRGRIFSGKMLADSHPVTQQDFDAAIVAYEAAGLNASPESGIRK